MGNSKEYNHKYWLANRKKLLIERAERYKKDKAYRTAVINRARAANAMRRLMKSMAKEEIKTNGKEGGRTSDPVRSERRRSNSKEGKGKVVRQGAGNGSGVYGLDPQYGELSKSTSGRGPSTAVCACGSGEGVRKGRKVRSVQAG